MTDYTKATNFATKDALVTGDPLKVVKGTEIDDEFNAIEDAVETKADLASPTFTGVPKAPTAATGTNTTQLATTAFVKAEITAIDLTNAIGADEIIDNSVGADELNVSGDGVAGQFLISDGDGSFSWTAISVLSPAASDPTTRDDGTSLAEGDQYYNTADDQIKTYDGTSWNLGTNLAGGSTGTTSTPPIGSLVFGEIYQDANITGTGKFSTGYGSSVTCTATLYIKVPYDYKYISDENSNGWNSSFNITSGTWQFLGGMRENETIATDFTPGLFVRTA